MEIPIYKIDAFTSSLFGGNPAAVCPLPEWLDKAVMQNIAAENNLAETAFFVKKDGYYNLRWFMPHDEIDLCGHATLASAFVIFNYLEPGMETVVFQSQSGILKAYKGHDGRITLDFPSWEAETINVPESILPAFGINASEAYSNRDLILLFENEDQILSLVPDLSLLKHLPYLCLIATAKGDSADFVSRVFDANAPQTEDPVTGSAHASLVPFWAKKLAKTRFHARQLSERQGELNCELKGSRVFIAGDAVPFLKGKIFIKNPLKRSS